MSYSPCLFEASWLRSLNRLLDCSGYIPLFVIGQISIFHLYGNPIFVGTDWGHFLGMSAVAVVLLVIGLVQFRFADV